MDGRRDAGGAGVRSEELSAELDRLPWGENGVPEPLATLLAAPRSRQRLVAGEPPGRLEFLLLAGLALSGWSARTDLVGALNGARCLQPRSGSYRRAMARLDAGGLWLTRTASFAYRKLALVRLTDLAAVLLQDAGLPVRPSEWERIERAHATLWLPARLEGRSVSQHTAAICAFLHHARLRGYDTEACPPVGDETPAAPDAVVVRDGFSVYVEVQRHGGEAYRKAQKWSNQARLQGFVAICGVTSGWALRLAQQAQEQGIGRGLVTDLGTLAGRGPAALWTHCWASPYSPIEPITSDRPEAEWLAGAKEGVYS
jgi:hypothetical protein